MPATRPNTQQDSFKSYRRNSQAPGNRRGLVRFQPEGWPKSLVRLLALALELDLAGLAAEVDLGRPLDGVALDLRLVLDRELLPVPLPVDRERHVRRFELGVFDLGLLPVPPEHRPGQLVPV